MKWILPITAAALLTGCSIIPRQDIKEGRYAVWMTSYNTAVFEMELPNSQACAEELRHAWFSGDLKSNCYATSYADRLPVRALIISPIRGDVPIRAHNLQTCQLLLNSVSNMPRVSINKYCGDA